MDGLQWCQQWGGAPTSLSQPEALLTADGPRVHGQGTLESGLLEEREEVVRVWSVDIGELPGGMGSGAEDQNVCKSSMTFSKKLIKHTF